MPFHSGASHPMIVRVLSVRIAPDRGAEFHAFVREHGLPRIQAHPGLISANVGRRTDGDDELAIVVTVWRDWEALTDALGPDPSLPYLLTPESGLVVTATVEHFEAIDLPPIPQVGATDENGVTLVAPTA
jgi:antibiotic biosynthesis monooxygenase (ABM) superfamily enzyme